MAGWIVVIAVLAFAGYFVSTYNKLTAARQLVRDNWAAVESKLQLRRDLIPDMLAAVTRDLPPGEAEVSALTAALAASSIGTPEQRLGAENHLTAALGGVLAAASGSPPLQSSESFLDIEAAVARADGELQTATAAYNNAARALNGLADGFPATIVAGILHIAPTPYFTLEALTAPAA